MTTPTSMALGQFSFSPDAPRWLWSDAMYTLHGMEPGDVVPTRELFLSHVHPEDRGRVEYALHASVVERVPAGCDYRLADLSGETRDVVIALAPARPDDLTATVSGVLIDDSTRQREAISAGVNAELQRALESHAVIDQAKGALMLVYGVDAEEAFQMLRWASQQRSVRLRVLAERLVGAVRSFGGMGPQLRARMDETFVAVLEDGDLPVQRTTAEPVRLSVDLAATTPTLRVSGRVDLASLRELAGALSRLTAAGEGRDGVVVDLRGVPVVGAAARFVLATAKRRNEARGIAMQILASPHLPMSPSRAWTTEEDRRPRGTQRASATTSPGG
ncbi:ANTAR domain-containing protein [Cellulomonas fengjieae]|uniref:ANTAR domain-containing protein n=1 Tax=Cellulomonas fengjieae TaxID=2819978 RepID=A0ABS3SI92_9CELL|nr:ANTAR domain-containing protein [Cellulomonas fengjieae]MBO3085463.1 ANTAR domain-containing protein [Cellulomonas fengjieae]QVI64489.1 ANTAR domain-containing protein [Cellulomonas fengjieae]